MSSSRPPALRGRLPADRAWPAGIPGLRSRRVRLASGLEARVVEVGAAAGDPLLLLHGWACSAFLWRRNVVALAEAGHRVIAADLVGHGFSDKPGPVDAYSDVALTEWTLDLMDALGLGRTAIAGHSMGGAVAVRVALHSPARVSRLALLAPVGFGQVTGVAAGRWLSPDPILAMLPHVVGRWTVELALRASYAGRPRLTRGEVDEYWAPSQDAGYAPALRHLLHAFDWAVLPVERLGALRLPVLVMFGSRDRLVVPRALAGLMRALPDGRLEMVEGVGHVLPEEAPDRVNAALLGFLREPLREPSSLPFDRLAR